MSGFQGTTNGSIHSTWNWSWLRRSHDIDVVVVVAAVAAAVQTTVVEVELIMFQHRFVVWSGLLGATASCLAKVAFSSASATSADSASPSTASSAFNPALWCYETCQAQITAPHQDLDTILVANVNFMLGELMVKHGIVLMRQWKNFLLTLEELSVKLAIFEVDWCHAALLIPRGLTFVLMLTVNALMVAYFLKGIQASGSVAGPALASATNFVSSAVFGYALWGETFSDTWWIGFASVLVGVVLLSTVDATSTTATTTTSATTTPKRRWKPPQVNTTPYASIPTKHKYGRNATASNTSTTNKSKSTYKKPTPPKYAPPPSQQPPPKSKNTNTTGGGFFSSITIPKKNKKKIAIKKPTGLTDRTFVNQCPICESELFDDQTGASNVAIADMGPACFHIIHAKCLKQQSAISTGNHNASKTLAQKRSPTAKAGCPVCDKTISMWISAKQDAHFAAFWIDRVEKILQQIGPQTPTDASKRGPQPVPAQLIRDRLQTDDTLTDVQKQYIEGDPTGLGKGLQSALEWGGYVDFNTTGTKKGHVGWNQYLRSRGIWNFNPKFDDLWLWEWDIVHPRQRCDGCQFLKRPLPVQCQGCAGSSEGAFYCSEGCQKRDWQRHKQTCEAWQNTVPAEARKQGA